MSQSNRGDNSLSTFLTFFGTEYTEYNFGQTVASAYGMTVPDFNRSTGWYPGEDVLSSIFDNAKSTLSYYPQSPIGAAITSAVEYVTQNANAAFSEAAHAQASGSIQQQIDHTFADAAHSGTSSRIRWNTHVMPRGS